MNFFRYFMLRVPQLMLILSVSLPLAAVFSVQVSAAGPVDGGSFYLHGTVLTAFLWAALALYTRETDRVRHLKSSPVTFVRCDSSFTGMRQHEKAELIWQILQDDELYLKQTQLWWRGLRNCLRILILRGPAVMLLGAALMRSGWLKGQFSLSHYRRTGALLIVAGMVVNLPAIFAQWHLGWNPRWCAFLLQAPRELGAPLQTIGYASLAWGFWPQLCRLRLVGAIACVGRMALTNYLLQTLVCTTIFYRFGLFMKFDRLQLLAFVVPVWAVNITFSLFWLRHFRQGPVEWLWRQLTLRASGASLKNTSR